jgi:hypothetical protein
VKGEGSNKKEARKKAASLMFTRLSNGGLEEVSFFIFNLHSLLFW